MTKSILIDKAFCGPPESGNGGYACGSIAANLDFPVQVTLRKPPPLNTKMDLIINGQKAQLMHGEILIAEAQKANFELDLPQATPWKKAVAATKNYKGHVHSPFPTCFVCGSDRKHGDGLKIHPGKVAKDTAVAAWIPHELFGNNQGILQTEYIWAAMDCPGAWAFIEKDQVCVLGQMAAKSFAPVKTGEKYIVMGWVIAKEGRKTWSGTAIFDENGTTCAYAKSTWIEIKLTNKK